MKEAWVRAERDGEVRQAARSWREANVIDEGALSGIEAQYSAAWPNPGLLWGVLLFFFVTFFVAAILFSVRIAHQVEVTAFLLAGGLAFAADRLRPSASTVKAAAAGAAAFWSVVCLLIGTGEALSSGSRSVTLLLLVGAVAWAAAAWRWGYPAFALFAAVFFFLLLARFPSGRALWLVLGAALAAACALLLDRPALAPSHRRGAAAVLAVSLAAIYAAVNLYALDHRFVESVSFTGWSTPQSPAAAARLPATIATAVFPLFVLGWGIRSRRGPSSSTRGLSVPRCRSRRCASTSTSRHCGRSFPPGAAASSSWPLASTAGSPARLAVSAAASPLTLSSKTRRGSRHSAPSGLCLYRRKRGVPLRNRESSRGAAEDSAAAGQAARFEME